MKYVINDYKVTSLPEVGVPNSRYYILNGEDSVDEYVTDLVGKYHKVSPIPRIELTTEGNSGKASYNSATGILNIPEYHQDIPEVHVDSATTTVEGITYLATQEEVNKGTDSTKTVTPATLAGRQATETRTGISSVATKDEVVKGINDSKFVTPLKLKDFFNTVSGGYAADIGDGVTTSFVLPHNLNSTDVIVSVYRNSNHRQVITDVEVTSANTVTIEFAKAPTENQFRVVIRK